MSRLSRIGPRRRAGFTLIELIMVMAIVALLVSITTPRYLLSLQRAREASLRSSLQTLRAAIDQYTADRARHPDTLDALAQAVALALARNLIDATERPVT